MNELLKLSNFKKKIENKINAGIYQKDYYIKINLDGNNDYKMRVYKKSRVIAIVTIYKIETIKEVLNYIYYIINKSIEEDE